MVWFSIDQHIFRHPWEQVVEAALRKYPNPETPNVSSTDIVNRQIDEEGRLVSTKVITSVWTGPFMDLMARISGFNLSKKTHAIEFSTIDPKKRTFQARSRNFTLMDYICVDETLSYSADPKDPESTILKQEWKITCQNLTFNSFLENSMGTSMKSNASKGRAGVEWVINSIKEEVENLALLSSITEAANTATNSLSEAANSITEAASTLPTLAEAAAEGVTSLVDDVQTLASKQLEEVQTIATKSLEEMEKQLEELTTNIENLPKKWEENLHEELQDFIKTTPGLNTKN